MASRWINNGGPTTCAACSEPFPYDKTRMHIAAQVGRDGKLYCYDTTCEHDALEAAAQNLGRAS